MESEENDTGSCKVKKRGIHSQLDDLYDAIDCLLRNGSFDFLDEILIDKQQQVWRMDLDILVGWATATYPAKSKLPHRKEFMAECIRMRSNSNEPDLWKGLE